MKAVILLVLVLLPLQSTFAAPKTTGKKTQVEKRTARNTAKLGTSFRFDGSALHGKLPTSASTTATVENDKFLEDLLDARKDFSDREASDLERQ